MNSAGRKICCGSTITIAFISFGFTLLRSITDIALTLLPTHQDTSARRGLFCTQIMHLRIKNPVQEQTQCKCWTSLIVLSPRINSIDFW